MVHKFKDLALDESLELFTSHRNDLASVSGKDHFEQVLRLNLLTTYEDLIGDRDVEEVRALLVEKAREVAVIMDQIDKVSLIEITEDETDPNTLNVEIIYDTGESFEDVLQ